MSVAVEASTNASGFVAASAVPTEEPDICCICCDVESAESPFINPGPCKCKGSIKFHMECLFAAMKHSATCGACKTPFTDPEFIGMLKRDLKPEEEVLMSVSTQYVNVAKAVVYYKADAAGVEQGTAYVFVEYNSWQYTGFYYFATVDFSDGVIRGEVGVAADYTTSPRLSKQKEVLFTVNNGEVCGAFLRYRIGYDYNISHGEQVVAERGVWLPGQKLVGKHEVYDWVTTSNYSQEFIIVEHVTYKDDGSGELTDGEHMLRSKKDPNVVIFANYKGGQLHGKWASHKNRREGSAPSEVRHYKNGVLHGLRTHYTPSYDSVTPSVPIQEIMYKDGVIHGAVRAYAPADDSKCLQLVAEGYYKNGMPVGIQRAGINGRLYEETTLAADGSGLLNGVCTYYRIDGSLQQRATFKMGVLDGFLRFYDDRSVERVRILMKNGRPKEGSHVTYFDASGSVEEERKVEFGAFLADFLAEGAVVRQNATVTAGELGVLINVQLRELAPEPEPELDGGCCCGMCYRSSHDDDYNSNDDYDSDDSYDRYTYRSRRGRRGRGHW